jgi:hypothetical protein
MAKLTLTRAQRRRLGSTPAFLTGAIFISRYECSFTFFLPDIMFNDEDCGTHSLRPLDHVTSAPDGVHENSTYP